MQAKAEARTLAAVGTLEGSRHSVTICVYEMSEQRLLLCMLTKVNLKEEKNHTFHPSTQAAEAGRVPVQPGLHTEFQGCIVRLKPDICNYKIHVSALGITPTSP